MRLPLIVFQKHEPTILYSDYKRSHWLLIPVCVCVCIYIWLYPTYSTHVCTYSLFCLLAGVFADGSGRVFSPCTSRYWPRPWPSLLLQLLSGIWLYYRLNSSHELGFSCSHPNALVSFFYEAPSQRKVVVPSFCLPICHILELLRMLALYLPMTYLSIWAQVWETSIALIELFAQFWFISWPNPETYPGPCPIIPVQHFELDSESCSFSFA